MQGVYHRKCATFRSTTGVLHNPGRFGTVRHECWAEAWRFCAMEGENVQFVVP